MRRSTVLLATVFCFVAISILHAENDLPVVGDWNGDHTDDVGVNQIADGCNNWYLDITGNRHWDGVVGSDELFAFGGLDDIPVTGDWNADNADEIGVRAGVTWYLDANGNRSWDGSADGDIIVEFGALGDTPLVGDWDGDGTDNVGVRRPVNSCCYLWLLDANGNYTLDDGDDTFAYFSQLGDVNSDCEVNGLDIDVFAHLVIAGTYQYEADCNHDGEVNGLDVKGLVQLVISGGCAQPAPEPSTFLLSTLALLPLLCWRRKGR